MTNDEALKILMDMVNNDCLELYDDEISAVARAIEAIRENEKLKQALAECAGY